MTYHQKAILCTSDNKGQGKATYWEDRNGKVTKKTKNFKSPTEIEKIYQKFKFDDPMIDIEEFINFSIPSPFGILSELADNFLGSKSIPKSTPSHQDVLPKGVDIQKHRQRLKNMQEKKKQKEQEKQKKEEDIKYLKVQLKELKNIKKELNNYGDEEGSKEIDEDIKKIEDKIKKSK